MQSERRDVQYRRQSTRLKGFDYSQPGYYFITLCTHDHERLFGTVESTTDGNAKMVLNEFGLIADQEWNRTFQIRHELAIDEYVIMPNHMHAIIAIVGAYGNTPAFGNTPACGNTPAFLSADNAPSVSQFRSPSQNLGAAIRGFKGAVAKRINEIRKTLGTPVWQRNYFDRINRDEKSLYFAREYMADNPKIWALKSAGHIDEELKLLVRLKLL